VISLQNNWILIRYGEIGLKSDYVRRSFEDRLINNIIKGMESNGIEGKVKRGYGRIFVKTEETKKASAVLERMFGVVSLSPCRKIGSDLEEVVNELSELGKEKVDENDSFAVRVRRTGDHGFSSKDVEEKAGAKILNSTGASVDLDNPDKRIMADIRQGQCYVFTEKIESPGGLPLGTQGKVLSLFKGGCGSFLSTWMMMKRGCSVVILHGKMEPYASDEKFEKSLEELKKWGHGSSIDVLEFDLGSIIFKLSENGETGYTCTLCRRFIHRLASEVAKKIGAEAIIAGDYLDNSFGDMKIHDSVTDIPVIRPLVGMDKSTIMERCDDIAGRFLLKQNECKAKEKCESDVQRETVEELENEIGVENLMDDFLEEVFGK